MKNLTIVALTLALSACASQPLIAAMWSKPGANYGAYLRDRSVCAQAARIPHPVSLIPGGFGELPPDPASGGEIVNVPVFWSCIVAHGWSYNPSAWLPPSESFGPAYPTQRGTPSSTNRQLSASIGRLPLKII